MEKLNNYQICFVTTNGKTTKCTGTETITAESLADAYLTANESHGETSEFFVYPLATFADGESQYRLADYCRKQFWKWEVRNNNAVMSALNRSTWDKEDERQDAVTEVWECLVKNPSATMFEAYHKAMNKLSASRDKLFRKNEYEYNPNALFTNPFVEYVAMATYPKLNALIKTAKDKADLTEKQLEILELYEKGIAPSDIQTQLDIAKRTYYQHYYTAIYKILRTAVELDGDGTPTFAESGLDSADIAEAVLAYAKRARAKLDDETTKEYNTEVWAKAIAKAIAKAVTKAKAKADTETEN